MNEIQKKCEECCDGKSPVKTAGIVLLGLLSVFVFAKTIAEFKAYKYIGGGVPATNVISVSGKGEIITVPDIALFSFTVSEENKIVAKASEAATKKTNAVIEFLKKSGVAEKDIKTTDYSIYPRYDYSNNYSGYNSQTLAAYVVSQSIEVKVRKIEEAGALLSGIGSIGVTNISGLTFSTDNYDEQVKEARSKAITDARKNAEKLAKDLDVELGRITSYYDQSPMPYYSARGGMVMDAAMSVEKAVAPQLPVGENKIISNVTVTYEIK